MAFFMYLKQPTTQQVKLQHTLQLLARTLRDQPTPKASGLPSDSFPKRTGDLFSTRSNHSHSKLSPLQGGGGKVSSRVNEEVFFILSLIAVKCYNHSMKKYLIMLCLFVIPLLALTKTSLASVDSTYTCEQTYINTIDYTLEQPFAGISKITNTSQYVNAVYRFALGIVGIMAVVLIMFGGLRWMAAAGNESIITEAKEIVTSAVIGLTIALLSYVILAFINPQILIFGFTPAKIQVVDNSLLWKLKWCDKDNFKDQQCSVDNGKVACNDVVCSKKGLKEGEFCRGAKCELGPGTGTGTAITDCFHDPQDPKEAAACQPRSCGEQVKRCYDKFVDNGKNDFNNYNICLCTYYETLVVSQLHYPTLTTNVLDASQETTFASLCEETASQEAQATAILADPATFGYTGGTGNIEDVGWNCGFSCAVHSEVYSDSGGGGSWTELTCI